MVKEKKEYKGSVSDCSKVTTKQSPLMTKADAAKWVKDQRKNHGRGYSGADVRKVK
jgi:hypothetical protein